jgi:antitoxin (DNA-binding transcriptional repressor) of toxin-antitoxin stability system
MRTAKIGVLRNQLSAYLRHVRNGEEVVIYDRNVLIAKIVPTDSPAPEVETVLHRTGLTEEEALLASTRKMKPPTKQMDWDAFWALPRPTVSDEAVREAIEWAKGDR